MVGNGSRSRTGCFGCRRRKRRCGEQKPICLSCLKNKAECIYPGSISAPSTQTFIVAASDDHYIKPLKLDGNKPSFLNLGCNDIKNLCSEYRDTNHQNSSLKTTHEDETASAVVNLAPVSPTGFYQMSSLEYALIQYYAEVISSSRVYVPTDRNFFLTSVMPRILCNHGPLLSTVLSLSSTEWSQNMLMNGKDYQVLAGSYKLNAIEELETSLVNRQSAEENLLTCVLLASLEIAQGSKPTWLTHLQGALAILNYFGYLISPAAARFALQYFRFRYVLMKTTQPKESTRSNYAFFALEDVGAITAGLESISVALQESNSVVDEHFGCSFELLNIINQIAALSSSDSQPPLGPDDLYIEGFCLEHKIQALTFMNPRPDNDYLLRSAETFRMAALVYLRLICFDAAITHPSILETHQKLLLGLSNVISECQTRRSFPMWPLFIAGCTCSDDEQRKSVLDLYAIVNSQWPISNISVVWKAVQTVWQSRDLSCTAGALKQKQRDWQEVIHRFGWKLSLT